MATLITSSPTTLEWLNKIRSEIERTCPSLKYQESKYYSSFKSLKTNRNIAYLHPQKTQIRLFTRLDSSYDKVLKPTPSSGSWAEMYPSIFVIKSEDMIKKAIELVIKSYEYDQKGV